MKIYTKTGDKGKTSLFGGKLIPKDDLRIESYGTVDELNSFIGRLRDGVKDDYVSSRLFSIQNQLFNIGSVLATDPESDFKLPGVDDHHISAIETDIDNYQNLLPELKNFILPGGHSVVSDAHICRTVTRRAERRVVALASEESVDAKIVIYLNRLSDYFFVLSRKLAMDLGVAEVKWVSE